MNKNPLSRHERTFELVKLLPESSEKDHALMVLGQSARLSEPRLIQLLASANRLLGQAGRRAVPQAGATASVPGFSHRPGFLACDEQRALLDQLGALPWEAITFRGQVAKRQAMYFGHRYQTNARSLAPAPPPTGPLADLWRRCEETVGSPLHQCIATDYPTGAGIGWHVDAPVFGEPIVGIAIKGDCWLKFRHPSSGARSQSYIEALALYILRGEARWDWEHSIPRVKEQRYSVTFRAVRSEGGNR